MLLFVPLSLALRVLSPPVHGPHVRAPAARNEAALGPLDMATLLHIAANGELSDNDPQVTSELASHIISDYDAESVLLAAVHINSPSSVSALMVELNTQKAQAEHADGPRSTEHVDVPESLQMVRQAARSILVLSASLAADRRLDPEEERDAEADAVIEALLTGATSASFLRMVLAKALCDRACQLSGALLSRGRGDEAREMLRWLLSALPKDTPSEGVWLELAELDRHDGNEEGVEAAAAAVLAATEPSMRSMRSVEQANADQEQEGGAKYALHGASVLDAESARRLKWRADALLLTREYEEAFSVLRRSAACVSSHEWAAPDALVTRYKLKHDLEQLAYRRAHGVIDEHVSTEKSEALSAALVGMQSDGLLDVAFDALPIDAQRVLAAPTPPMESMASSWSGRAALRARSRPEWAALERMYLAGEVVILDNFLTDDALRHLRHLACCAPVWHESKPRGYLGAYDHGGFAPGCVARLASELSEAMPGVFDRSTLNRFWGYKYESTPAEAGGVGGGICAHVDPAKINANFWLTADSANLDTTSGGMVVWSKQPSSVDDIGVRNEYNTFSTDEAAHERVLGLVDDERMERTVVPYRANRCVLFSSDRYHKTDTCAFKSDYASSRINLTLLFGFSVL